MGKKLFAVLLLLLLLTSSLVFAVETYCAPDIKICTGTRKHTATPGCKADTYCTANSTQCLQCAEKPGFHCTGNFTTYTQYNVCKWAGGNCVLKTVLEGGRCHDTDFIPEFFGIEFGEMEISTGIIALIGAILLPSILFRKKRNR